jgi:hypothetical protein
MGQDYEDILREEQQNEIDRNEPPEHPRSRANPNWPFNRKPKCLEPDYARESMKAKQEAEQRKDEE